MKQNSFEYQFHKDDIVTVKIEDIGASGEGIGHVDVPSAAAVPGDGQAAAERRSGFTLFVKDAVPGDTVRAKLMKVKKGYGYARLLEVTEPSPHRVPARCPIARQCGGCQIQELSYEQQFLFKQRKVREDLIRIGGFSPETVDAALHPVVGMEEPWRYRNKAQYPVGERGGEPVAGFYAGRTHYIVPAKDCLIGAPENAAIVRAVLEYMKCCHVPVYDEQTGEGLVRHILIRSGFHSGEIMVCLVINAARLPQEEVLIRMLRDLPLSALQRGTECALQEDCPATADPPDREDAVPAPRIACICLNSNRGKTNAIMGRQGRTLWGRDTIEDSLRILDVMEGPDVVFAESGRSVSFCISPLSFYQVNPRQTERLYSLVRFYAGLTGREVVWDVYCGVGTISCFLAPDAKEVFGVEIIPEAVRDARENARRNGLANTTFVAGKAEEVLPAYVREGGGQRTVDVVVVDPPRKGCDPLCLQTILDVGPSRVIYVSCDPATLARDLQILTAGGYELRAVRPVDMFPHSIHVETVVLMSNEKSKPDSYIDLTVDVSDIRRLAAGESPVG